MTGPDAGFDVAIVGAGAAGTYIGYRLKKARPDWRIAIFERSNRVGGRLWSVHVDGLPHPIELGGMRYMSGHPLVQSVVDELGIETRAFDPADQPERTFLRGVIGRSPDDPEAGRGYDLPAGEQGRSASDLMRDAFLRIVPQARDLDEAGWRRHRATQTFGGRALTDWSIAEAVATILSPEGHRFATDAFGYDSGIHPHNAGDAIQYVMGTGYPSGRARVPVDGMDRIPREIASRFEALGGTLLLGHDVERVEIEEGSVLLGFADGSGVRARRLVLTLPIPALEALAEASPIINGPTWQRLYQSIAGFPGDKAVLLVRPTLVARRRRPTDRPAHDDRPAAPEDLLLRRGAGPSDDAGSAGRRSSPPSPTTATTSRSSPWPTAGVGEHRLQRPSSRRSGAGWRPPIRTRRSLLCRPARPSSIGAPTARGRMAFLALRGQLRRDDRPRGAARPVAADPPLRRGLLPPRGLGRRGPRDGADRRGPACRGSSRRMSAAGWRDCRSFRAAVRRWPTRRGRAGRDGQRPSPRAGQA